MACPTIREVRVRAVRVPMAPPHKTASGTISESPLVLTDIVADDGTVGHSMIFTYAVAALKPTADLIKNLESFVKGEPLAPTRYVPNSQFLIIPFRSERQPTNYS